MEFGAKTEIKIKKQTSRRFSFENAHCRTHFVCHPTPGHFLPYQKARCKCGFKDISSLSSSFFLTKWNECWWKAAILLFALECVLLSRLLLNSAVAGSCIQFCILGFFFMPHSHPLSFLSHLVIFPQQHSVSFLFDVQRMNKAVCNIYIRVSCLDMPRMKSRHQTAKTF